MNTKARVLSILQTSSLPASVTGMPTFSLAALQLESVPDVTLPNNLRLGHLAEQVVSHCITASASYSILHQNIQIREGKQTVGELDFILKEEDTQKVVHVEMAYKFYLYDPSVSAVVMNNWIGPNRNDSLSEKLKKLKERQFPLLHSPLAENILGDLVAPDVSQALCLLASLYVPYGFCDTLDPDYTAMIKGHYLHVELWSSLDTPDKRYYLPPKKEWGMDPTSGHTWNDYATIKQDIYRCTNEKQAPLCWEKRGSTYSEFFIVWW